MGIEKLIRPDLATFGGYAHSTSPETLGGKVKVPLESIVKLDANENPYGCSTRVNQALAKYPYLNIYPDDGQTRLRELLAGYTGVNAGHIVAGSGSNQLIDIVVRLFISKGDEIINCVVPVITVVDGACASAATFMSIAGKKRLIKAHSYMLIHQLSGMIWGKYREIKDEMVNVEMFMEDIKRIYAKFTSVPEEEIDEILSHDIWWPAEKCIEYKLADEII